MKNKKHIELINKILLEKFPEMYPDYRVTEIAVKKNNINLLEELARRNKIDKDNVASLAVDYNELAVLKWAYQNKYRINISLINTAVIKKLWNIHRYLVQTIL